MMGAEGHQYNHKIKVQKSLAMACQQKTLVACTPDATNMMPLLENSVGIVPYASNILDGNGVPRGQSQH